MKTVLGIDPGTKCGWAIRLPDGRMAAAGVWDLSGNRFEGAGMRFIRMTTNLNLCRAAHPFDMIAFEEVRRHMGVDAAHCYGGIIAQIMVWCEENNVPYSGIPVASIKKLATGKGNADKTKMVAAAKAKWPGHASDDDNAADALWIAETAAKAMS